MFRSGAEYIHFLLHLWTEVGPPSGFSWRHWST